MAEKVSILVAFAVILALVAVRSVKRLKSYDDFNLNGRRTGLPMLVATLGAAEFNTATLIGGASVAYLYGTVGLYYTSFIFVIVFGIYALTVAKPFRRLELTTVAEFFERRFTGPLREPLRAVASVVTLTFAWIAPPTYLAGLSVVVSVLLGIDPLPTVIGITIFCLILALVAGFVTALAFDAVAFTMIVIFIPAIFVLGYVNAGGFESLSTVFDPRYLSFEPIWDLEDYGFAAILTWCFQNVLLFMAMPSWGQRVFSARNESVAKTGMLITAVMITVLYGLAALATMFSRVLMPDLASPEEALPRLILDYAPPLLQGLMLVTLLLVGISTLVAVWNSAVSVVVNDLLRRYAFRNRDSDFYVWLSRGVFVVLGISTLALALTIVGNILLVLTYVSVFTALLAFPILAGLFWRRFTTLAALLSIVCGVLYVVIALIMDFAYHLVSPVGVAISVVVGVVTTYAKPGHDDEDAVDAFYAQAHGKQQARVPGPDDVDELPAGSR